MKKDKITESGKIGIFMLHHL